MPEIGRVGVVGLGTMGAGIVEVFARNGFAVVAVEVSPEALERGKATLTGSTDRAVARGKLSGQERDALLGRVELGVGLSGLSEVDLVVEAVPERLDLKRPIFAELNRVCRPDTILATNTSSLPVTEIAVASSRPQRVVGMHFFNPAPVMRLVEVVRTVVTDDAVVMAVQDLCTRLGKVGVTIADRAGFIANTLLFGYLNQAVAMYESRFASREDIDAAMRHGCGLPMGPLALLDLIGLDTSYEILETIYRRGGRNRRHAPRPLLLQMVTAGLLGRKTGRGFYEYERPGSAAVVSSGDGEPEPEPAQVATVGVAGSGLVAESLVELVARGGFEVTSVAPGSGGLDLLAGADLIIEAVADDLDEKRALLAELDRVCRPGAVFATTTATLPVAACAAATGRPDRVVGLHLVGPGPDRPSTVAEIVGTVLTTPDAVASTRSVARRLDLHPVVCGDRPGFVVNALLMPYLNDAVGMLEARYATADDIDHAMTLGCGYPSGPCAQLDAIGLDVALEIQQAIYRSSREPGLAPVPLLEQLVTAGRIGRGVAPGLRPTG